MQLQQNQDRRKIDWRALEHAAGCLQNPCRLCVRRCGARRAEGERGFCGAAGVPQVTKIFITHGEERFLNPAYMLYFAACNMRCRYCSNAEFIAPDFVGGVLPWNPERIAAEIDDAWNSGRIHSLQLLGGEPTVSLVASVEVVRRLKTAVPVVWNSNFYFSSEAFAVLDAFVDFYVADLKFGCDRCAMLLADAPDYMATVVGNLRRVEAKRLLIRHLQLGGHQECCSRPVLEVLTREFAAVPVSFHPLLPDPAGICKQPDSGERAWLDEEVRARGLLRQYAEMTSPVRAEAAADHPLFSGEILIRPDGTIAVQDLPANVWEILSTFTQEEIR